MPEFKSTTTRLLVDFAKGFFDVKLPDKNKALIKGAIISAEATRMKTVIQDSSSDLLELKTTLNNILNKLKEVGTNVAKQNHALYESQAAPIIKNIDEHNIKREALQRGFDAFSQDLLDKKVRDALQRVETAPDVEATSLDQSTRNTLESARQSLQAKKVELAKLERDAATYQQSLKGVIMPAFNSLPVTAQNTTPLSKEISQEIGLRSGAKGG